MRRAAGHGVSRPRRRRARARRGRAQAVQNGAATVPGTDPLAAAEAWPSRTRRRRRRRVRRRERRCFFARPRARRRDRPCRARAGRCLYEYLCVSRDVVTWATASAVVCGGSPVGARSANPPSRRRQPRRGGARDAAGRAEMGVREALAERGHRGVAHARAVVPRQGAGGSKREGTKVSATKTRRRRVRRSDLSDDALLASADGGWRRCSPASPARARPRARGRDGAWNLLSWNQQQMVDEACPRSSKCPGEPGPKLDHGAPGGAPVPRARLRNLRWKEARSWA